MKKLLREYRVELIALAVVVLGVFLLVEQFEIRVTVRDAIIWLATSSVQFVQVTKARALEFITKFSLSDLIGWSLILGTVTFFALRARYRFTRSDYWRTTTCPKCGSPLERIPRKRIHYILGKTILPHARRYRCSNKECQWTGLRHHQRVRQAEPEAMQFPPEGKLPLP
jgi:hypothetical protein